MLTDGEADGVEVHILDNELLAELLGNIGGDLHVDAVVVIALHVLKGLESGVGRNNELILALIENCGLDSLGSSVAEILVADSVECSVALHLFDYVVYLSKQLGLILVNTESILLVGQVIVYNLDRGGLFLVFVILVAAAGCKRGAYANERKHEGDYLRKLFHDVFLLFSVDVCIIAPYF